MNTFEISERANQQEAWKNWIEYRGRNSTMTPQEENEVMNEMGVFEELDNASEELKCVHDYLLMGYDDIKKAWMLECHYCKDVDWEYEPEESEEPEE